VISRERSNGKTPVGLKTDSVISKRSSSRDGDTRTSTTISILAEKTGDPSPMTSTTACRNRNCDWRTMKKSLKGLWKSAGVKRS
jgi:hypothetical protein